MKEYEPKECALCGAAFMPTHWKQTLCPECRAITQQGRCRHLPRTYEGPADFEAYEKELRARNFANYTDRIVAAGYAERQKAKTLEMVGRVKI